VLHQLLPLFELDAPKRDHRRQGVFLLGGQEVGVLAERLERRF